MRWQKVSENLVRCWRREAGGLDFGGSGFLGEVRRDVLTMGQLPLAWHAFDQFGEEIQVRHALDLGEARRVVERVAADRIVEEVQHALEAGDG